MYYQPLTSESDIQLKINITSLLLRQYRSAEIKQKITLDIYKDCGFDRFSPVVFL